MSNIQALVDAQKEMNRCVTALHLELLPEIADDVQRIWDNLSQALADYHKSKKEELPYKEEFEEYLKKYYPHLFDENGNVIKSQTNSIDKK